MAGFQSITWFAIVAPPCTPACLTQTNNKAIGEVLQLPGIREQFNKMNVRPVRAAVPETERVHRRGACVLGRCHPDDKYQD